MKPQFLNARKGGRATEEIALRRGEKFMRDTQNQAYHKLGSGYLS